MKDLKDMKRVLLKLSGEALAGDKKTGFDMVLYRPVQCHYPAFQLLRVSAGSGQETGCQFYEPGRFHPVIGS